MKKLHITFILSSIFFISCNNSNVLLLRADKLLEKNDYSEAIEYYNRVLEKNPMNFNALQNIGIAYYFIDDFKSSIDYLNKAITIESNDEIFFNLALAQYKNKQFDTAIKTINEISSDFEYNKANELNLLKGYISFGLGAYEDVINYFDNINDSTNNSLNNNDDLLLMRSICHYRNSEFHESYKILSKFSKNETNPNIKLYLASSAYSLKKFEESISVFNNIISVQKEIPDYFKKIFSDAHSGYGDKLYFENNRKKALDSYTKSIEINDKNAEAYFGRGIIFYEQKMLKEAKSDFRMAAFNGQNLAQKYLNILEDEF